MTQVEFLEQIITLQKDNPEMKIHFCVDSDEIAEDGWTVHKIFKVEISPWFEDDEHILTDEDDIKEHLGEIFTDDLFHVIDPPEELIQKAIDEKYKDTVEYAICVYTHAG